MNYRMICRVLGMILGCLAALLFLPMSAALIYGEGVSHFLKTIAIAGALGLLMTRVKARDTKLCPKDGFAIVGLGWILMSAFGALPFVFSGDIPNFIDAMFETASGFTTTGASILTDIEGMSRGCLFWRSFTHWVGGMGVLVFIMAILPMNGNHSMHIMRAEVPGPTVGKLVPRARKTAVILYLIYFGLTMLETIMLRFGGLSWYDALLHAFATAGTGGFSTRAASVGAFDSAYVDMVIAAFMFLFSLNFNLYYLLLIGRVKDVLKNEELRWFTGIVLFAIVTMAINISDIYGGFVPALRYSIFNTLTVSSTTGFGNADFTLWPEYSKWTLVLLMVIGACAGSTGGGIKISRLIIILKASFADLMGLVSPRHVRRVQMDKGRVANETVRAVYLFCTMYMLIMFATTWALSFDGYDITTNLTATISCLSNIGPGMGLVGPCGSFAIFSQPSKLLLTFVMLVGRLEIYPIIVLFIPAFWKK